MSLRFFLVWALALTSAVGCGPVAVRQAAGDALRAAEARLVERGIALDAAGRRADAFRTERYCYVPPDAQGNDWARSLIAPYRGPLAITVEGDAGEQAEARRRCAYLFRVEVTAQGAQGSATLTATGEWWRLAQRRCETLGNALVGRMRCEYGYDGAVAPQAIEPHFHSMFTGL
ncbi:hypothetical protein L6V77_30525 [Myxococcota bacterium]|nr:hypothetical protein [Myxococcota bacterium]